MTVAYVTDTHPLIWYLAEDKKLPRKVRQKFDEAVEGQTLIWVPTAVMLELSLLLKTGRIKLTVPLELLEVEKFYARSIEILRLELTDIYEAQRMTFSNDLFDTLIVAAARRMNSPLLTADSLLHEISPCDLFWG